ncbi:MAG: ribonuclease J [Deltaproteobacteria bacterium]|jgi:ribonuclease J|nr:ribonuclease J [Deltaproteobacteria bacterium]
MKKSDKSAPPFSGAGEDEGALASAPRRGRGKKEPAVDLVPLGGLGEIGLNCMALVYGESILIIDAGLMFPGASQPGVDLVIPDFSFLRENYEDVLGLVLTHGHEDHIGALSFLLRDCPGLTVFGTRLTLALARNRLQEQRQTNLKERVVAPGDKAELGPFKLEFIRVNHSIPDALAVAVETPAGVILHTGDFKMDLAAPAEERLDLHKFAEYGNKGVLALLSDSTNADVPGFSLSEKAVERELKDVFVKAEGRIFLSCFASSLARIRGVAEAAAFSGRVLAFDGRSVVGNVQLAGELGRLKLPEGLQVDLSRIDDYPPDRVCVVLTGSQGEPLASLARLANGVHQKLQIRPGDLVVFSARAIPGNEAAISVLVNLFLERGAEVLDPWCGRPVHASGHGCREELKLMYSLVRPRYLVPVHGEHRHLKSHAKLAVELGHPPERALILKNGRRLTLKPLSGAQTGEGENVGRLFVDGSRLGSSLDPVIRKRRKMSGAGLVIVTAVVERESFRLLSRPRAVIEGVRYERESDFAGPLAEKVEELIFALLEEHPRLAEREDAEKFLAERIRVEVRRIFSYLIDRKPVVVSQIIPVDL